MRCQPASSPQRNSLLRPHEVFRNYKILPSPTHHYLFVLDNIENSLLPRKQIELEIQLEKLLNTALPHEIQSNTIQLTEFLINGE